MSMYLAEAILSVISLFRSQHLMAATVRHEGSPYPRVVKPLPFSYTPRTTLAERRESAKSWEQLSVMIDACTEFLENESKCVYIYELVLLL
jgi:hypothetical protein